MNKPTGDQILTVYKEPSGEFATSLSGDANDCFNALLCVAGHFASGVNASLEEVCQKMLEAVKNGEVEKVGERTIN